MIKPLAFQDEWRNRFKKFRTCRSAAKAVWDYLIPMIIQQHREIKHLKEKLNERQPQPELFTEES